jgi:hypothetical protein
VATSPLSPDEIRAAAETHHELPPEYQNAVIESFLDRVGKEIDARVDARLAAASRQEPPPQPQKPPKQSSPAFLAVASLVFGIPLTAIVSAAGPHPVGFAGVLVVWAAIAVMNVAWAGRLHWPRDRN